METFVFNASSLQHMARVKIVTQMWSRDDIKARIEEFERLCSNQEKFELDSSEIEEKVVGKVSTLAIPEMFKDSLRSIVKPIGWEIVNWWHFHNEKSSKLVLGIPNQFIWTSEGAVDRKKMAELMVKDERLDLEMRYILACIYCLEDEIRALWNRTPQVNKSVLYGDSIRKMSSSFRDVLDDLLSFWTCTMVRESVPRTSSDCSLDTFSFACLAADCCSPTETELILRNVRRQGVYSDKFYLNENALNYFCCWDELPYVNLSVIFFILNETDKQQQEQLFSRRLLKILEYLLRWPWQGFFLKMASHFWHLMDVEKYKDVLRFIFEKIGAGYKDYDYGELFKEIWNMGCPDLKKAQLLEYRIIVGYLSCFFEAKKMDLLRVLLNDIGADLLGKLIFYYDWRYRFEFQTLIGLQKWDLIKYLMDQSYISDEMIANCKLQILRSYPNGRIQDKCKTFLRLADDFVKRKVRTKKRSQV